MLPISRRFSVRVRVALTGVMVLLPVLLISSGVAVLLQRSQLTDAVSLVAAEQARAVARTVEPGGDGPSADLAGLDAYAQIVRQGRVIQGSPVLRGAGPLTGAPPAGGATQVQEAVPTKEGERYVVASAPVSSKNGGGYVVVARPLEQVDAAVESTLSLLAVGIPLLTLAVAGLGWWGAGRALAPVDRMRRRAGEITAADLSTRLPLPGGSDEVASLAETLNGMLTRLEASSKAQRQFTADASHELRSPVAAVRAVVEVADRTDAWDGVIDDVIPELDRLERLISGLLVLARGDAGVPRRVGSRSPVDVSGLVQDLARRPRRVPVLAPDEASIIIETDLRAVEAILVNLIDNAARHAVSAVNVRLAETPRGCEIEVSDDGAGIAPEDVDRVFDRFVRLDEARTRDHGGAGLGLSIGRALALELGGALELTPRQDGLPGACFRLTLPARGGQPGRSEGPAPAEPGRVQVERG